MSIFYKLRYCKYYGKILFSNWSQSKESYSQHGEDILVESLFPNGVRSFIDIGANDGVLFSNTYKFAKLGAQGICVEPSTKAFRKLKLNHLLHPKVKCLKVAISKKNAQVYFKEDGYESTLSKVINEKVPGIVKVNSFSFDDLLKKYSFLIKVDMVSVDVEGHENEVFEGLNNPSFKTKLLIVESDKSNINNLLSISALENYIPYSTNGINTILLNKDYNFPKINPLPKGFVFC